MKLSIVVAAYDEVENVAALFERLERTMAACAGWRFEMIFVVAGEDGTWETLRRLAAGSGRARLRYEEQPAGLGNAFRHGFEMVASDSQFVVTLDADLNHRPEEIPRLVDAAIATHSDIVVGSRRAAGSEVVGSSLFKSVLSTAGNWIMHWLYGLDVRDKTSGFRVYKSAVLRQLTYRNSGFAFLPEMLILASSRGFSIHEEPIRFVFREKGRSKMALLPTSLSYFRLFLQRLRKAL